MPIERLQRELARSRMQFEALADNIPQLAWMADGDGYIFWYNRRWHDYAGTTLEEMQGWNWRSIHHPDFVDGVVERFTTAIENGEPWEDTFPLRSAHGEYRWFLSRAMPVRDESGKVVLWCGTNTDVTDRRENADRIIMLMQEVNHRSRNMLSMVQTILNRSSGADSAFVEKVGARIQALSANQDLLNDRDWLGADLGAIVRRQISHAADLDKDAVTLAGPDEYVLKPSVAEAIGLAMHELATNALKHGALSRRGGAISIEWGCVSDAEHRSLSIRWTETGGPAIAEPTVAGFGTAIIKRFPEMTTGGTVEVAFPPEGLRWSLMAPWDIVTVDGACVRG